MEFKMRYIFKLAIEIILALLLVVFSYLAYLV